MCGESEGFGDFFCCLEACSQGGGTIDFSVLVVSHGENVRFQLTEGGGVGVSTV